MKKVLSLFVSLLMLALVFAGCSGGDQSASAADPAPASEPAVSDTPDEPESTAAGGLAIKGDKPKIGYAQSRMNHPYRVVAVEQLHNAVEEGGYDWEIIVTDANNDPNKQTSDVEDLIAQDCDIICITPITAEALVAACQKVQEAGIPLILIDRYITTDDYDYYVGGNNVRVGRSVGEALAKAADGQDVKVMEFMQTAGSSVAIDRDAGFMEILDQNPNIECIGNYDHNSMRDEAMKIAEDVLVAQGDELFAIFTQNDEGALGVLAAAQAAGVKTGEGGLLIYGGDGQQNVFDEIKAGNIAGTVIFPTGTPETIQLCADILSGKEPAFNDEPVFLEPDVIYVDKDNVDEVYHLGLPTE